jgi:ubiquinone/menaquinone biosynthesis C-methylase UbiE
MTKELNNLKNEIIDLWKTEKSPDYGYFYNSEDPRTLDIFWNENSPFLKFYTMLNMEACIEIAPGHGRHSEIFLKRAKKLHLIDTSVDGLNYCKKRLEGWSNVEYHLSEEGDNLAFCKDSTVTSVISYDAMVHFELLTVASYMREIARVLIPGGRALLHHSNLSINPTGSIKDIVGWRNFMSMDIFAHLGSRFGLNVVDRAVIDWCRPASDGLTLLEKTVIG